MARTSNRLTAMTVQKLKEPGRYADGGGLYLQIGPTGGKSWLFRYTRQGKAREMGLGALNVVSLADAREAATSVRRTLAAGHDPLETRKAERQQQEAEASGGLTFSECASAYIEAHKSAWRNEKHVAQWSSTIKTYVEPVFGTLPVQAVNLEMVLKALEPIWQAKPETAARLRGRIESVLDWAAVRGHRSTDNPARWKGHLDKLLPPRSKVQRVQHHAALPFEEIGAFMAELRQREEGAARALEFTILTASRTSEVLNARWDEFDLDAKVWRNRVFTSGRYLDCVEGALAKVRQEPRISANKLGEYLVASPGRRRTILQDQKYPDDFKTARYKEATQAISRFLAGGAKDLQILQKTIGLLEATSPQTTFQTQDRDLSIEALKAVISNHNQWSFSGLKLAHGAANVDPLTISGVAVSVRPEIVATSADKKGKPIVGAIKLHLPKTSRPNKDAAQYVTTLLHWHATERLDGHGTPSFGLCKLVDVHGGLIHDAPKAMTRRRADIEAACQEIAIMWSHL